MIITVKLLAILALLLVATGAIVYYMILGLGITGSPVAGNTTTTISGGGQTTTTSRASGTSTTTTATGGAGASNAWLVSGEEVELRLTSEPLEPAKHAPVYINGVFHNYSYIKMLFKLTIGNETKSLVFTWSLGTGPYTARCHNFMDDRDISIELDNATIITVAYNFSDGYWIKTTVYLKDAEYIWAFNKAPIPYLDTYATPHGAQAVILGAVYESSDPRSNGWWSSAIPFLPIDEGAACEAIVHGSPEVDSLQEHLEPWLNLNIPGLLQPVEAFELLQELGQIDSESFTATAEGSPYNEGTMRMNYLGLTEYPGTGVEMHMYNVTITTDTEWITAWTLVAAESIIPIEYHAYYPQGIDLQGTPARIDIKVVEAHIENT